MIDRNDRCIWYMIMIDGCDWWTDRWMNIIDEYDRWIW